LSPITEQASAGTSAAPTLAVLVPTARGDQSADRSSASVATEGRSGPGKVLVIDTAPTRARLEDSDVKARRVIQLAGATLSASVLVAGAGLATHSGESTNGGWAERLLPEPAGNTGQAPSTENIVAVTGKQRPDYLATVVVGRMFQNGRWVIHAADKYQPKRYPKIRDRRIAYVCDTLAYLHPTYVSGLIRLSSTDAPSRTSLPAQAAVFDGVRDCVYRKLHKPVKYDVVLNALHYTDPHPKHEDGESPPPPVPNAHVGKQRIRERLRTAQAAFHPDGWFFDFYANPYKKGHFSEPLEFGIKWIKSIEAAGHPKPRQFVGGTVWGGKVPVPPGSNFIAVTDRGGAKYTKRLVEHFKRQVPILMHIDNDPEHKNSRGRNFYDRTDKYREETLRRHAAAQKIGYSYMFPVFFPLGDSRGHRQAFDMRQHPALFRTMCRLARSHCGPTPDPQRHR
jgi:hypothetical protein